MKRLKTHIEETEALENLEEGLLRSLVRTGSVLANANASKRHGDIAVKHLKNVLSILSKPISSSSKDPTAERLNKIENGLFELAKALIAFRYQSGATTGVATSAALLASNAAKYLKKKK